MLWWLLFTGLTLSFLFPTACLGMDVTVSSRINALNGTTVRITCIFTSCYKIDVTHFNMNWTYQESLNHTEEKVKQISLILNTFSSEALKLTVICLSLCSL